MNLARHSISSTAPLLLYDLRLETGSSLFTISTPDGFAVYRTCPLELVRKREVRGGTLSMVVPMHVSSLLFLVGGGRSPRYPPNKVVFWDDVAAREVAELEFRERVRGIACRLGWLAVALRRRVVVFEIGMSISRYGEWETCENPRGLLAIATGAYSTLLAVPGRQIGHVQLIHLPPCRPAEPPGPPPPIPAHRPPPPKHRSHRVIVAHNTALSTLTVTQSGRLIATTSLRGTLVRIWDAETGKQVRELRRGTDQASIYGTAFRPDEAEICVWSDKGTVHIFALTVREGLANRQSPFSGLSSYLPLPKYFESEWSYAQFRIPTRSAHIVLSQASEGRQDPDLAEEEKCTVGWFESNSNGLTEYQLIALTFSGGWYRLALPRSGSTAASTPELGNAESVLGSGTNTKNKHKNNRVDKGKNKGGSPEEKTSRDLALLEYRRFGSWDGWG